MTKVSCCCCCSLLYPRSSADCSCVYACIWQKQWNCLFSLASMLKTSNFSFSYKKYAILIVNVHLTWILDTQREIQNSCSKSMHLHKPYMHHNFTHFVLQLVMHSIWSFHVKEMKTEEKAYVEMTEFWISAIQIYNCSELLFHYFDCVTQRTECVCRMHLKCIRMPSIVAVHASSCGIIIMWLFKNRFEMLLHAFFTPVLLVYGWKTISRHI